MYTIENIHIITPTFMISENGKKVWEETFDLWGKPHDHLETRVVGGAILTNVKPRESNKNQAISQPFRFPGQYHDEETGLYYNRYRYYMPNEGMYTQRDPIGLAGGNPTVYGYVRDTLKQIDPFGLRCSLWKPTGKKADLWNKGKLKSHYDKHGAEFGAKSSAHYSDIAYKFGISSSNDILQIKKGGFIYRFDPSTKTIFVGTDAGGKIKTFYIWDGRPGDAVIDALREAGLIR